MSILIFWIVFVDKASHLWFRIMWPINQRLVTWNGFLCWWLVQAYKWDPISWNAYFLILSGGFVIFKIYKIFWTFLQVSCYGSPLYRFTKLYNNQWLTLYSKYFIMSGIEGNLGEKKGKVSAKDCTMKIGSVHIKFKGGAR